MFRALTELSNRGLLPDQMKNASAQQFLYYGVDFADHVWDGPPEAPTTAAMSPASYVLVDPNNPTTFLEFENFTGTGTIGEQPSTTAGNPVALAFCNDVDSIPFQRCNRYAAGGFDTSFDLLIDVHIDVGSRVGIGNGFNGAANVVGTPFTDGLLAQDPAVDVFCSQNCPIGGIGCGILGGGFGGIGGLLGDICPIGFTNYPNLQMNQPVRTTSAMLLRTYVRPWADYQLGTTDMTPTIEDFALDNLYHYSLSDLSQFATPGSDQTVGTAVITYPLLTKDIPDPPIDGDDIKSWVISNMQFQPAIGRTGYGAPTYGSILFQLARKFFEGSASAPSITELPKAGNDIDGWHTGGMYGNAPLQSINLDFPHTYLGGNPFICLNGVVTDHRDPCAQNPPSWPIWVLPPGTGTCTSVPDCGPTFFNALQNPTPARSNRVALIYLGWAAHLMEDQALPHHASNWTSQEHQRQDNLGDLAAASDPQNPAASAGQPNLIDWSAEMQSDIDALLAQVTPDNVDTFCAQQSLARSEIQNGSLNWQGPYPAFVQQAKNAFDMRRSEADLSSVITADFQTYAKPILKNAVLGTIKLLLCAPPICPGTPMCSGHGTCPDGTCSCALGYTGADCSTTCPGGPGCSGHGTCTEGVCGCAAGYSGADCSVTCPGGPTCSAHGTCTNGVCGCAAGYSGADCSVTCPGGPACSNHGTCGNGTCTCASGYSGADCSVTCPNGPTCSGHGTCTNGSCGCASGYSGADCSVTCPGGPTCSGHGTCTNGVCGCATGYSGSSCSVTCPGGPTCSSHGTCTNGVCGCATGYSGADCSVTCPGGPTCSGHGTCNSGTCACGRGFTGSSCSVNCASGSSCPSGTGCNLNGDCASRTCTTNVCVAPACAPHCNPGNVCGASTDCGSGVCTAGTCHAPACSPLCAPAAKCGANADCASRLCSSSNTCVAPTCSPNCAPTAACGASGDCLSRVCTGGLCQPPVCSPHCATAAACGSNNDCTSHVCTSGKCR